MKTSSHTSPIGASAALAEVKARVSRTAGSLAAQATVWIEACADYYAAAAMYEQLSALSDAELRRRGLSRATLASDICKACDRATI
jgi:hypothetical protein